MDRFRKKFIPSFILRAASRGKAYSGAGPRTAASSTATAGAEDVDFLGVRKRPGGRYTAEIIDPYNNDCISLGTFDTAVEAAMAYDRAARSMHGSEVTTNFIYGDRNSGPDSGGGDGGGSGGVGDDGGGDHHDKGTGGGERSGESIGGRGNDRGDDGSGGGGNEKDATTLFFFDVGAYNQWRSNARRVKILILSFFLGVRRRRHLNGGSLASFRCRNSSILSIGRGELTGEHKDPIMATPCLLDGLVA